MTLPGSRAREDPSSRGKPTHQWSQRFLETARCRLPAGYWPWRTPHHSPWLQYPASRETRVHTPPAGRDRSPHGPILHRRNSPKAHRVCCLALMHNALPAAMADQVPAQTGPLLPANFRHIRTKNAADRPPLRAEDVQQPVWPPPTRRRLRASERDSIIIIITIIIGITM